MSDDPTIQSPTIERLEEQIAWYGQRSARNQRNFKVLKVIVIVVAAVIPLTAGLALPTWVPGALGVVIAVAEGIQQLYQFQANWIAYRSTAEALKHEKYLYLAKAGPYAAKQDPLAFLAEQIEAVVSQEHAKWASGQEKAQSAATPGGKSPE